MHPRFTLVTEWNKFKNYLILNPRGFFFLYWPDQETIYSVIFFTLKNLLFCVELIIFYCNFKFHKSNFSNYSVRKNKLKPEADKSHIFVYCVSGEKCTSLFVKKNPYYKQVTKLSTLLYLTVIQYLLHNIMYFAIYILSMREYRLALRSLVLFYFFFFLLLIILFFCLKYYPRLIVKPRQLAIYILIQH